MSIQLPYFVFREARTSAELKALFHLRHQGYLHSSCAGLVRENPYGLEFDSYDWHAHHLGFFREGPNPASPVGYIRLVQDAPGPMAPLVSRLAGQFPTLLPEAPSLPLPLISSCSDRNPLLRLYHYEKQQGHKIVEGSRLVFAPSIRAAGYARFVFECTLAFTFFRYGYDYALLACHPRHAPFYRQYGFEELAGGADHNYRGMCASILGLEEGSITPERAARVEALARRCTEGNGVRFCPTPQPAGRAAAGEPVAA